MQMILEVKIRDVGKEGISNIINFINVKTLRDTEKCIEYFFVLLLVDNVTIKAQCPPTISSGDRNLTLNHYYCKMQAQTRNRYS